MQDDFDHDDDNHEEDRLPPGAAFFYAMPVSLLLWGVLIWWVMK